MSLLRAMLAKLGLDNRKSHKENAGEIDPIDSSPFNALTSEENHAPIRATPPSGVTLDPDTFVFQSGQMPRSTLGLYYPEDGVFLIRHPDENRTGLIVQFGGGDPGLIPLSGDWNGDGIHGIGLYDPQTGLFMLRDTVKAGIPDYQFLFGPAGEDCLPLVGDWDGDGIQTVGLYKPADGAFYLSDRLDGGESNYAFRFGPSDAGWLPVAGDWNGNGLHTVGGYDPARGYFYLRDNLDGGEADAVFRFGPTSSKMMPLSGDWDGTGRHSVGLYDSDAGIFYLRSATHGSGDRSFQFGSRTTKAIAFSFMWV